MKIAQKSSISNLFEKISNDKLTILIDHALLEPAYAQNQILQSALKGVELLGLRHLLLKAAPESFHPCEETHLSSSFEKAFSYALDSTFKDGLFARGALAYQYAYEGAVDQISSPPLDEALGFAVVHLCHWRVGGGHVMLNGLYDIDLQSSEALREKLAPFFLSEGIELFAYKKDAWLARSKHFINLPSASLSKAMNDDVLPWLIGVSKKDMANTDPSLEPSIQLLRRLQSEVQMFLYDHPTHPSAQNTVNSIWFSGTGMTPTSWDPLELVCATEHHEHELFQNTKMQILCIHELSKPMQHHDLNTWFHGLKQIDELFFKPLAHRPQLQIILCGQLGFKIWNVQEKGRIHLYLNTLKQRLKGERSTLQLLS